MQPENMSHDLVFVTQLAELGHQHGQAFEKLFKEIETELDSYTTGENLANVSEVYQKAGKAAYTESLLKNIKQIPAGFIRVILLKAVIEE